MKTIFDYKVSEVLSHNNLHLKYVAFMFLVVLVFCTTLCSTFFPFKMNDNYFQLLPLSLSIGLVSAISLFLSIIGKSYFRFSKIDALLVIIVAYYAARYDYQLQLANWKIIYAFLLLLLWFAARIIFSSSLNLKSCFIFSLIGVGALFAIWGLLQLYGCQKSNHALFSITGPFYNRGPYSGYIAMIIPLCLDRLLLSKGFPRYFCYLALFLMLSIVPAGMSRSAWLAVFVSCLWLLAVRLNWINALKQYARKHPYMLALYSLLALGILLFSFFLLFQIKSASAAGRIFIWKNTITAILERPILGYGPGSFPSVYGRAQSAYFASGNYTELEEYVAGSPEYAFNECLQMGIEGGILLLILFVSFFILSLVKGMRNKEYGVCGTLLCLLVFSMFSYPFQELTFGIVAVVSFAICCTKRWPRRIQNVTTRHRYQILYSFIILIGSCGASYLLRDSKDLAERWHYATILKSENILDAATDNYDRLYDKLKHNSRFLLSYSKCLSAQENIVKANWVLERAKKVCCDPILRNMQGCNHQLIGEYLAAEACFKEAIQLIPIRVYPYFLLAKLYGDQNFFDDEKALEMANIVLTKKPKIYSKAIDEMRAEMTILLSELLNKKINKKCKENDEKK